MDGLTRDTNQSLLSIQVMFLVILISYPCWIAFVAILNGSFWLHIVVIHLGDFLWRSVLVIFSGVLLTDPEMPIAQTLNVAHPLAYLWLVLSVAGSFARYVEHAHDMNPSLTDKPWSIALYSDEVMPGDAFSATMSKKIQVVYYSFLNLDLRLCREKTFG